MANENDGNIRFILVHRQASLSSRPLSYFKTTHKFLLPGTIWKFVMWNWSGSVRAHVAIWNTLFAPTSPSTKLGSRVRAAHAAIQVQFRHLQARLPIISSTDAR